MRSWLWTQTSTCELKLSDFNREIEQSQELLYTHVWPPNSIKYRSQVFGMHWLIKFKRCPLMSSSFLCIKCWNVVFSIETVTSCGFFDFATAKQNSFVLFISITPFTVRIKDREKYSTDGKWTNDLLCWKMYFKFGIYSSVLNFFVTPHRYMFIGGTNFGYWNGEYASGVGSQHSQ